MYIFIFFSIIYLINLLVNKLSKVEDVISENDAYKLYNCRDKIEIGFPIKPVIIEAPISTGEEK